MIIFTLKCPVSFSRKAAMLFCSIWCHKSVVMLCKKKEVEKLKKTFYILYFLFIHYKFHFIIYFYFYCHLNQINQTLNIHPQKIAIYSIAPLRRMTVVKTKRIMWRSKSKSLQVCQYLSINYKYTACLIKWWWRWWWISGRSHTHCPPLHARGVALEVDSSFRYLGVHKAILS